MPQEKNQCLCHTQQWSQRHLLQYCIYQYTWNPHKYPGYTYCIYPRNVNGTLNKQGPIHHTAILQIEIGNKHKEFTEMAITNIGCHNILLGTNWFKAHNPSIDWAKNQLCLNWCPHSCYPDKANNTLTLGQLLPTEAWEDQYNDYIESKYHRIDASQCIMAHLQAQYNDYTESKYHGMNVSPCIMAQQCKPVVTTMVSPTSQQHYENYKYRGIVVLQRNMA